MSRVIRRYGLVERLVKEFFKESGGSAVAGFSECDIEEFMEMLMHCEEPSPTGAERAFTPVPARMPKAGHRIGQADGSHIFVFAD